MNNPRDYALELIDEGMLNARDFAIMCVKWMSVHDVEEMLKANEIDPRSIYEDRLAEIHEEYIEDPDWRRNIVQIQEADAFLKRTA
jgi:hypothetical protein